jgi:hypothetical protein
MRHLAALLVVLWLGAPAPAEANPFCRWVGLCLYMSPGFELTVVDAETGTPLPEVYAWAEWVQHGAHGIGGPLVVQDGFSGADGRFTFPRWGPRFGSRGGLLLGTDPAVILFKPGYGTLLIENGVALGASQHASIRGFSRSGASFTLRPFRGSSSEWVEQLRKLSHPALHGYVSDAHIREYRPLYLRRLALVDTDVAKMPPDAADVIRFRSSLELDRDFLVGEK